MARSARSRVCGLNLQLPNGPLDSDLNLSNAVVYDTIAAYLPELRQRVPDCRITLRLINNSRWDDPEGTAWAGADLVKRYPQVDFICPGNELEYEHKVTSAAVAAWCQRFAAEWGRQGWPRPIVTPAVSTGYPFDLGALQAAWETWDAIGVHCYAALEDLGFTAAKGHLGAHRERWPEHPLHITESDIEKLEETTYRHAEGAAAYEQWLDYVTSLGYVAELSYFLQDSHDQPYRLVRIPPLLDLHRRVGHEADGANPGPEPPDPPADDLAAKYNLTVVADADTAIGFEDVTNGTVELEAYGPPSELVTLMTADGLNRAQGHGRAAVVMAASSKYFPQNGEHGPWQAMCAGAAVYGLGMMPDHSHPRTIFRPAGTAPAPTGWAGAFAQYATEHPHVGSAIGDVSYHPEPGAWTTCGQVSESTLLVWNGWTVIEIDRL